jgi:hypothetical protein
MSAAGGELLPLRSRVGEGHGAILFNALSLSELPIVDGRFLELSKQNIFYFFITIIFDEEICGLFIDSIYLFCLAEFYNNSSCESQSRVHISFRDGCRAS